MISYKPLKRLMLERELKSTDMINLLKISSATMSKINANQYVSLEIIDRICIKLSCNIEDVVEHVKKED